MDFAVKEFYDHHPDFDKVVNCFKVDDVFVDTSTSTPEAIAAQCFMAVTQFQTHLASLDETQRQGAVLLWHTKDEEIVSLLLATLLYMEFRMHLGDAVCAVRSAAWTSRGINAQSYRVLSYGPTAAEYMWAFACLPKIIAAPRQHLQITVGNFQKSTWSRACGSRQPLSKDLRDFVVKPISIFSTTVPTPTWWQYVYYYAHQVREPVHWTLEDGNRIMSAPFVDVGLTLVRIGTPETHLAAQDWNDALRAFEAKANGRHVLLSSQGFVLMCWYGVWTFIKPASKVTKARHTFMLQRTCISELTTVLTAMNMGTFALSIVVSVFPPLRQTTDPSLLQTWPAQKPVLVDFDEVKHAFYADTMFCKADWPRKWRPVELRVVGGRYRLQAALDLPPGSMIRVFVSGAKSALTHDPESTCFARSYRSKVPQEYWTVDWDDKPVMVTNSIGQQLPVPREGRALTLLTEKTSVESLANATFHESSISGLFLRVSKLVRAGDYVVVFEPQCHPC